MTWTDIAARGRGQLVYFLELHGIGVISTYDATPGDAWYVNANYTGVHPWLAFDFPRVREQFYPLEGRMEVSDLTATISDVGGGMTALVRSARSGVWTRLTSTLAEGEIVAALVEDTTAFPAPPAVFWVGQEAVHYAGAVAGAFTLLTRGYYGTRDVEHYVDLSVSAEHPLPEQPIVSEGPQTLIGVRATLHAAEAHSDGTISATEVVYRGRVKAGVQYRRGEWRIPIEHISTCLLDQCATRMQSGPMPRGYYYHDPAISGPGHTSVAVDNGAVITYYDVAVPAGWYERPADLAAAWNAAFFAAVGASPRVSIVPSGDKWKATATGVGFTVTVRVDLHSPLHALGCTGEAFGGAATWEVEFPEEPIPAAIVWGDEPGLATITVADASIYVQDQYVVAPGQMAAMVDGAAGTTLVLGPLDDRWGRPYVWWIEEEDDLVLSQVLRVHRRRLDDAIYQLTGATVAPDYPRRWLPATLEADDFDSPEWTAALASLPSDLLSVVAVMPEPLEVWRIIGPMLAILGIAPRVTAEGRIGAARVQTPTATQAISVPVDHDIWSLSGAVQISAGLEDQPRVNAIEIQHSRDYRAVTGDEGQEWPSPIRIEWAEGAASLGRVRTLRYDAHGLCAERNDGGPTTLDLATAANRIAVSIHFGLWGRLTSTITVPSTWTSRQVRCGDIVELTHELAPDIPSGVIGATDRLAIVVGRHLSLTGSQEDDLEIMLPPDGRARGIAPCALATSWDPINLILDCPGWATPLYAPVGRTDLDAFVSAGAVAILCMSFDQAIPLTWVAQIAAGGANLATGEITLAADPFAGAFPGRGVYVVPASWDNRDAIHDDYCWIAAAAARPQLGPVDVEDAHEWSI